jgi:hypothetical protein
MTGGPCCPEKGVFIMINKTIVLLVVPPVVTPDQSTQSSISMGSARDFAVLAGSSVVNTGTTVVHGGDVGTSPGDDVSGFPPGVVNSPHRIRGDDATTQKAQSDLMTAYRIALAMVSTHDLSGQNLGGLTILPGVYNFSSAAELNGTLTLNNQGDPRARFIFKIGTTLTTGADSAVITIDGGPASEARRDVTWLVGGSATLGQDSTFEGDILASTGITMQADASISDGCALTQHGQVTLDSNKISRG